jgi:hypothetical protein
MSGLLPHFLLLGGSLLRRFLVGVAILVIVILIFLSIPFWFVIIILVVLVDILVDVFVGTALRIAPRVILAGLGVVIRIGVLVISKIYMKGVILLGLGCWRDGAFEEYEPP